MFDNATGRLDHHVRRDFMKYAGMGSLFAAVAGLGWTQMNKGPTTTEDTENLRVMKAIKDALNTRDYKAYERLVHQNYVSIVPAEPQPRTVGLESNLNLVVECTGGSGALSGFHADYKVEPVAYKSFVFEHWEVTGKHTGVFAGIAPTGRDLSFEGVSITKFSDGKPIESTVFYDTGFLLRQGAHLART